MTVNDKNLIIKFTNDGWIEISNSSLDFFGNYSKSRNGKYILAWGVDHSNDGEMGRYLLLDDQKIILDGFLQRPNDGKVANNGVFVINDWLFERQGELKGNFVAYNKKGDEIISRQFSANLVNNGLSDDGKFAICQVAHSNTDDSDTVTCFDLTSGQELWQKIPETRMAVSFEFDGKENVIYFVNDMGKFKYSLNGEFLDDKNWYQARLERGSAFDIIEIADAENTIIDFHTSRNEIKKLLDLYLLAIQRGIAPYYRAKLHRKVGEIYELLGKNDQAVINYEKALKCNPSVGVKKKLQALRPDTATKEKHYPFSIKTYANSAISFEGAVKGVDAGYPPRGVYFQIDHYKDACWYIKNHYKSGLEKGESTISITTSRGDLLRTVGLNHLVYKAKRASTSDYFAIVSYDLDLYLYSPDFELVAKQKISKDVADRYEIKHVDVSPSGNLVIVTRNNELILYGRGLQEIKVFKILLKESSPISPKFALTDERPDGVSSIEAYGDNEIYFGTYSGIVNKLVTYNYYELVYKCGVPVKEIKRVNNYLFISCDKSIDILKDAQKINTIERQEGFGRLIWSDIAGLEITKRFIRLFTLTGVILAEIEFNENVADCFLYGNRFSVSVNNKSYIFNILSA